MTLFELLTTMQDVNVDLHLYENYTYDENNEGKHCEEIKNVKGTSNQVFIQLSSNGINTKFIDVFYIGYVSSHSRTLRVNGEVKIK